MMVNEAQNYIQVFFSGTFRFHLWWTPNKTQILFIEEFVSKDWRV